MRTITRQIGCSSDEFERLASFLRSSRVEVPDQTSQSRFMRPRYVKSERKGTKADGLEGSAVYVRLLWRLLLHHSVPDLTVRCPFCHFHCILRKIERVIQRRPNTQASVRNSSLLTKVRSMVLPRWTSTTITSQRTANLKRIEKVATMIRSSPNI